MKKKASKVTEGKFSRSGIIFVLSCFLHVLFAHVWLHFKYPTLSLISSTLFIGLTLLYVLFKRICYLKDIAILLLSGYTLIMMLASVVIILRLVF